MSFHRILFFNLVMVRFARSTGPRSGVRRGCWSGHDDPAHPHPGPLQLQPHRLLLLQLRLGLRLRRRLPAPAAVLAAVAHPARQLITRRPHLQMPPETKLGPRGPRYSPPGQPFPDLNAEGIHPSLSNLYCTRQMSEKVKYSTIFQHNIIINPTFSSRRVNREIIQTMVQAYSRIFGNLKPVFDGRSNLYVKDPLPIGNDQVELKKLKFQKYVFIIPLSKVELEVTLDSEGRDRVFRVTIKWVAQVSRVLVPRRRSLVSTRTAN